MIKQCMAAFVLGALALAQAWAQVDVNKADQAALDSVKGVGPKMSQEILDARSKGGPFKDWVDFQSRMKGVKDKKAAALSRAGLTVNGQALGAAAGTPKPAQGAK